MIFARSNRRRGQARSPIFGKVNVVLALDDDLLAALQELGNDDAPVAIDFDAIDGK
jgi:hypothetical protein